MKRIVEVAVREAATALKQQLPADSLRTTRLLLTHEEAARTLSVSERSLSAYVEAGDLTQVRLGRGPSATAWTIYERSFKRTSHRSPTKRRAFMASIHREKRRGRYRVQFRDKDGKRRSIRLGDLNRKASESICHRIEHLVSASIACTPLDIETAKWVANLGETLAEKLANAGLIPHRESAELGQFIDNYIVMRTDASENTIRNWRNSRCKLTAYFSETLNLRDIAGGDAHDWRQSLVDKELGEATISKAVKHAKQFFSHAVRKKLLIENPFEDLTAGGEENPDRKHFVSHDVIEAVIDACPDAEWRLIVALARYGGLRVPSEVQALERTHIDWAKGRFKVPSPKTKRQKKGMRTVPIFPELEPFFLEANETAADGSVYMITRHRGKNANLRTQLLRIIAKAGQEPWPRLFHNLRASRQTELENQFPGHVVCEWLGNSQKIADKHYHMVIEEHFAQARGGATGDPTMGATGGAPVGATGGAATDGNRKQQATRNAKNLGKHRG